MKLLKKSEIEPIAPHGNAQLYRYQGLLEGVNVILSQQAPKTSRSGGTPVKNLCLVLEGTLEVTCGDAQFTMGPGDAASFEAGEDRTMVNNGDAPVTMVLVDKGMPGGGPGSPGGPGGPSGPNGPGGPGGPGGPPPQP